MLTQKILSRTVALAMTASITVLAGCPNPAVIPATSGSPTDSSSPAVSASAAVSTSPSSSAVVSTSPSATATAVVSGSGSPSATAVPSATTSTTPSGSTGSSDIKELATFNGKVFDRNGVPVDNATVSAVSSDAGVTFTAQPQTTVGGSYVFRNAPVGSRILVTVTKSGWTTRQQTVVLKSNLTGDPNANVLNFGTDNTTNSNGNTTGSAIYAIQDEPEVTSLKINDRPILSAFVGDRISSSTSNTGSSSLLGVSPTNLSQGSNVLPGDGTVGTNANIQNNVGLLDTVLAPSLTGVAANTLKVELTFSEPVDRASVEQNFRIRSQNYSSSDRKPTQNNSNIKNFVISNQTLTSDDITYTWATDDTSLVIQTKRGILTNSNNQSDEFRYLVDFQNQFQDKTNVKARTHSSFRFSPSQVNDFAVFSTADDNVPPQLTSVVARDGSTSDTLELAFSEDMDVISQTSPTARLTDTFSSNNANTLSFNNVFDGSGAPDLSSVNNGPNTLLQNGATIMTFADTSDSNTNVTNTNTKISKTNYSYMIGKLFRQQLNNISSSSNVGIIGPVTNGAAGPNNGNTQLQENLRALRLMPLGYNITNDFAVNSVAANANGTNTTGVNNANYQAGNDSTSFIAPTDFFAVGNQGFQGNNNQQGTTNGAIRDVRVVGNRVLISLAPSAFQTGDQIVVSAGTNISGNYTYQSTSKSITVNPQFSNAITGYDNLGNSDTVNGPVRFKDPAGNEIDRGNSATINNATATNAQKSSSVN